MAMAGSAGAWLAAIGAGASARAQAVALRGQGLQARSSGMAGATAKPVTVVGLPKNSFTFEEMVKRRGLRSMSGGGGGGAGSGGGGSAAFGLTHGAAPAVVKVISFGHGGTRAAAMGLYVLRDEVVLHTYDDRVLSTQVQVNEEMKAWAQDFDARAESDDVVKVRLWLTPARDQTVASIWGGASGDRVGGARDETPEELEARRLAERAELKSVVAAGFAGHRFAYAMGEDQDGRAYADVVSVMVSKNRIVKAVVNAAGDSVEKTFAERLRMVSGEKAAQGPRALNEVSEKLLFDRISKGTEIARSRVRLQVSLPGHGVSGAQNKLDHLIQKGAEVYTEAGSRVSNVADSLRLAKSWKRDMHSHGGRDVMHAMISARANENVQTFTAAVQAHLKAQFGDHKYVFGVHTDKAQGPRGHIHAHVLVAVKSESGVRFNPNKDQLLEWRQNWASEAQQHGLRIVATQAMTQANSQSYGDRDKAIIEVAERPRAQRAEKDRSYARRQPQVVEAARRRVEAAQTNAVKVPVTPEQRMVAERSFGEWLALRAVQPFNRTVVSSLTRLQTSIKNYDHAERAARLDPQELARVEAAERQSAAHDAQQAAAREAARQRLIAQQERQLARLPISTHEVPGGTVEPVMTVAKVLADYGRKMIAEVRSLQEFGQVKTGELNAKGEPIMTVSAAKMKQDLEETAKDVTSLSAMLSGGDRIEFDQRAAHFLNTLTGLTNIQTFIEKTGRDHVTRAEYFEIAGPAAATLLDSSNALAKAEKQEAERLQTMAVRRVQRDAASPSKDAAAIQSAEDNRRVMRDADKLLEDASYRARAERAQSEFDRITSDPSLSFQERLDALRKIDDPSDTFDPEKHRPKPPLPPEEQIVEYIRAHPELSEVNTHTNSNKHKPRRR